MNPLAIFMTGLTAGGVSCLAMQAGLLTTAILNKQRAKTVDVKDSLITTMIPTLSFLVAKLVVHTLFGAVLGGLGAVASLSLGLRLSFQVIIALFMLATAFNLIGLHPIFRYVSFNPPRILRRLINKSAKNQEWFAPSLLGALTLFIPCGVTQAMELAAVGTGNSLQGAVMMFMFVLGTFPMFILFGVMAKRLVATGQIWLNRLAAAVLIVMSMYYLHGVAVVLDSPLSINKLVPMIFGNYVSKTGSEIDWARSDDDTNGVQRVTIRVNNNGYAPRQIKVKKGIPVELKLVAQDTYSCALAFVLREFGIDTMLKPNDTQVFTFTPTKKGRFTYTCSMGMYSGTLEVE